MSGKTFGAKVETLRWYLTRWWRPGEIRYRRYRRRTGFSESQVWWFLYGNPFFRSGNVEVLDYWYSDKGHLLGWARAVDLIREMPPENVWV